MNRLELNKEIYSVKKIEEVRKIYEEYAVIRIIHEKTKTVIIFDDCKYDEKQTMKEFENYLIGLENSYGNI